MSKYLFLVLGVTLVLTGLWGGSWLLVLFPFGSDYSFAALVTGAIIGFSGLMISVFTLIGKS